jgi:acyl-homoserine-lactone acylase
MSTRQRRRFARVGCGALLLLLLLSTWIAARRLLRPEVPPATPAQSAQALRVKILRDTYGVPHVYGDTDADTAFGLAYVHAEDDWPTIERVLAASRGRLALVQLDTEAVANDYYVALFDIPAQAERHYEARLSPETRAVLEGYANGLNFYAALHPDEVDSRLLPYRGVDIAAGFLHKLPLLMGVGRQLGAIREAESLAVGDVLDFGMPAPDEMIGSNSHAVGPSRSADGVTRLNVNSHQPWTGPVAWYEAHLVSGEGWNMSGGTFPGGPFILHGHNEVLGWAHTVNSPDLCDVYQLEVDDSVDPPRYRLDGEWRELEVREGEIVIDALVADIPYSPRLLSSVHGPVMETDHGFYAIRCPGLEDGRLLAAAEQWFRMNRAQSLEAWRDAMRLQGLAMFNTIYADAEHVGYVYNALLPRRLEEDGLDWRGVLDGTRGDLVWSEFLTFDELPQVFDPPGAYVQNCNSTPWQTTEGPGNPDQEAYAETHGITNRMTNRALRSHELFGADDSITRDEFLAYKWDRTYSRESPLWMEVVVPLLESFEPATRDQEQALELIRGWDGSCGEDSRAATLAILAWRPLWYAAVGQHTRKRPDVQQTFRDGIAWLIKKHQRVDVPLGEVQRLRRGAVDLPLGGGPDLLNAIHGREDGNGAIVGVAGDSLVVVVEFPQGEPARSWAVSPYGSSNRPASPHYADQAELFAGLELRPVPRTVAEIRAVLESEYHPGQEPRGD